MLMDTRKHVAIRQETHTILKEYCTSRFLNIGAFIDNLIRRTLKEAELIENNPRQDKLSK
jgi:hypothetical protein